MSHPPTRLHIPAACRGGFAAAFFTLLFASLAPTGAQAQPTSTSTFTAERTPALRINEVLAANTRIALAGTFPDIIELHNAGSTAADLSGRSLTDDPLLPRKYVFPAGTTIPAGGYLVVYADANSSAPGLHTGFALDAEGDRVRLLESPGAGGAVIDEIVFGFQVPDHSISRTGAEANVWALTAPTPGAANGAPVSLAAPGGLKLNEWAGKIAFRLDHDMIELFNPAPQPVALAGVRLTDDPARPTRFVFPALSFIAPNGFLALFGADFGFGLDGDVDPIHLYGENGLTIDQVVLASQPRDFSTGRNPDGSATISNFAVPTPGMSNQTLLPAGYSALLSQLRITEVMYQPAGANPGDYEYIELQNIGTTPLDLSGVRFTNGLTYTFPPGTTLAGGAFIVVAKDRTAFLSRHPAAAGMLAPGVFSGALDNTGETLALTLPSPWYVHILRFRYEPNWFAGASGGGYSLVVPNPATTPAVDWREPTTWRASAAINGSPGAADAGSAVDAAPSRIINLSILTSLSTPGDNFRMGFVVGGHNTSGAKPLVIRAAGPSLGALGVGGTVNDPKLDLFAGTASNGGNDNWGGSAGLTAAMAAVGAFAYMSPTSLDAAMAVSTNSRDNTVLVSANGNGTGLVIAEVYDASPEATVTAATPRLINVSVLKEFAGGFTAGFVIRGPGRKTVLVRAVGPGLAAVGVPSGFVSDPQLVLFGAGSRQIGANDNWGGTAELTAAFGQVGAFTLQANSRDAALLATLEPGDYTVQVSGVAGGSGLGLVEIYEVP